MEYFKFNNSRSTTNPFFIYLPDVRGNRWAVDRADLIPVTEEEYTAVKASYENSVPKPGDQVVIIEYLSLKQRYGVVKEIIGDQIHHNDWVHLEDGREYMLRDVRTTTFIHKS